MILLWKIHFHHVHSILLVQQIFGWKSLAFAESRSRNIFMPMKLTIPIRLNFKTSVGSQRVWFLFKLFYFKSFLVRLLNLGHEEILMAFGWSGVIEMVTTLIQFMCVVGAILVIWGLWGFLQRFIWPLLGICIPLNLNEELGQICHPFFRVVVLCQSLDLRVQIEERLATDSRLARELGYFGHWRFLLSIEARVVRMGSKVLVRQITALFLVCVSWVALRRESLLLCLSQFNLV